VFEKIGHELFWDFAHWLGRKYESDMPAIMRRFRQGTTFGNGTIKLIMPTEYKAKRFVAKTWHNPYTERCRSGQPGDAKAIAPAAAAGAAGSEQKKTKSKRKRNASSVKAPLASTTSTPVRTGQDKET
jgi:hypothetical protein